MSANALIRFYDTHANVFHLDECEQFYVYQRWDGYPAGVAKTLEKAFAYAWRLPRFEASDFACAFIAANKPLGGGNIRLADSDTYNDFEYHVTCKNGEMQVKVIGPEDSGFNGTFEDFCKFAASKEEE